MNGYGKYLVVISGVVNIVVLVIIGIWYFFGNKSGVSPTAPPVSYPEFISIMLSALGVILTALAISMAVVGVFGFESIKRAVVERATTIADEVAKREVQAYIDTQEQRGNAGNAQLASVLERLSSKLDAAGGAEIPAPTKPTRTPLRRVRS